jgi:hypothetical protein
MNLNRVHHVQSIKDIHKIENGRKEKEKEKNKKSENHFTRISLINLLLTKKLFIEKLGVTRETFKKPHDMSICKYQGSDIFDGS